MSWQVIDSTDKIRVQVVMEELEEMLDHKHIEGRKVPILFFANKARPYSTRHYQSLVQLFVDSYVYRFFAVPLDNIFFCVDADGPTPVNVDNWMC